jgi:hypothetical protein
MGGRARIGIGLCVLAAWTAIGAVRAGAQAGPGHQIHGWAVYDKLGVTPAGLDRVPAEFPPIRGAVVEALDPATQLVVASGGTDSGGRFLLDVPGPGPYRIRLTARLVAQDVVVRDNTRNGEAWSVSRDAMAGDGVFLRASDARRVAGAFNILEAIRRANAFIVNLEPGLELPPLTLFWSPLNTDDRQNTSGRYIGGTSFFAAEGFALILGDRSSDSDEFDDDVILHEYAHFLAARFSRDDSVGGPHAPGDVLDPRVAWSEGWANFFSSLVTGDPVYRDSRNDRVLEYDLESGMSDMGVPGYWDERTVHELLWDLVDTAEDGGDMVTVPPETVWRAFRSLSADAFVYLPSFLDRLVADETVEAMSVEQLARMHLLDYLAGNSLRTHLFPKLLDRQAATGELDSWSQRRMNLARSAHLYAFDTSGGLVSIDLQITGLGSARNPEANDLDLYLMDSTGRELRKSAQGGNGAGEAIETFLPPGRYVVEVRSFSRSDPRGPVQFNAGSYRLSVDRP